MQKCHRCGWWTLDTTIHVCHTDRRGAPSIDDMWKVIQELSGQVAALQAAQDLPVTGLREHTLYNLLARIYRANYVPTADETFPNQEEIEKALGIGREEG